MKAMWKDDIAAIILRIMSEEMYKYTFSSVRTWMTYTSTDNVPPSPTLHLCDAARSKHRYIHIRPEVVGWAPPV